MPNVHSKEREKDSLGMSHAECRAHICAVCYSESSLKASRLVSEGQEKIIRNEFSFI